MKKLFRRVVLSLLLPAALWAQNGGGKVRLGFFVGHL